MKVLTYGIGKKFYGGKYNDGCMLSAEVLNVFTPTSYTVVCNKRFYATNGYIVNYGYEKNYKDESNRAVEIKILIEKIERDYETSDKPQYGPQKNCGHYIVVNDKKLYVNVSEDWNNLAEKLNLQQFMQEDVKESIDCIYNEHRN